MESYGIQVILAIKFHPIQWNLMGPFQQPNLIKPNGILWDRSNLKIQMESNGIHEALATKSHQIHWNPMGPMLF